MIKKFSCKSLFGKSIDHELFEPSSGRAVKIYKAHEYSAFSGKWEPKFWVCSNGDKTLKSGSYSECYSAGLKYVKGLFYDDLKRLA